MYTSCLLSDSKFSLFCPAANSMTEILPVFHSPPFTLPNMYRDRQLLLKVSVTDRYIVLPRVKCDLMKTHKQMLAHRFNNAGIGQMPE